MNKIGDSLKFESEEEKDEDIPTLSADTLALLAEFQQTKSQQEERFLKLQKQAEAEFEREWDPDLSYDDEDEGNDGDGQLKTMEVFTEDWNLSQFWYTDETARQLSAYVLAPLVKVNMNGGVEVNKNWREMDDVRIAIVSAPTVHQYLTRVLLKEIEPEEVRRKIHSVIFEHDRRFEVFGRREFVEYDFNAPKALPDKAIGWFTRAIVDPPFLSEECQVKTAMSVRLLVGPPRSVGQKQPTIVVCTGEKVAEIVLKAYKPYGLCRNSFEPRHRAGLQNEFRCFVNEVEL
ncbi:putative N6-adenine methyltransferase-domain-containing protein [Lipomyces oligophaga]|uniref:putative N6-adenine methyltransferase-domain-containing protein n=1 Tax=Lipomyces oligophaga TaxID=45792 RepID=UPI0034CD1A9B